MHYWQGAKMMTACGQSLVKTPTGYHTQGGVRATGIDSAVKCGNCKESLRTYRKAFPQGAGR